MKKELNTRFIGRTVADIKRGGDANDVYFVG